MTRLRLRALAVVGLIHAGLFAALTVGGTPAPSARSAVAITAYAVQPAAVTDPVPAVTFAAVDPGIAAPAIEIAADPAPGDCSLTETITAALAHDAEVGDALTAAGPDRTTLMIWDGHWASDAAPIRRVVVAQVRAAPVACRDAAVVGPRLLIVPAGSGNVALALGSGTWTWAAVLS